MNILSRTITGSIAIFIGAVLIVLPFFLLKNASFFMWIYGIPIFIIGVFILSNKREDKIEKIKSSNKLNKKTRRKK